MDPARMSKGCLKCDDESQLQFDIAEVQDFFDRLSLTPVRLKDHLLVVRSEMGKIKIISL